MSEREAFRASYAGHLADGRELNRVAVDVSGVKGEAPAVRVQLMPAGQEVKAIDGRSFRVLNPAKIIAASRTPMLLDWEHASESGGSTRAAGWLDSLEYLPAQGMLGVIRFTAEGAADARSLAYRYLSPVLVINKDTREVEEIASVALTNTPALRMAAIDAFARKLDQQRQAFSHADVDKMARKAQIEAEAADLLKEAKADNASFQYLLGRGFTREEALAAINRTSQQRNDRASLRVEQRNLGGKLERGFCATESRAAIARVTKRNHS